MIDTKMLELSVFKPGKKKCCLAIIESKLIPIYHRNICFSSRERRDCTKSGRTSLFSLSLHNDY